jgi:hypothetical protein
MKLNELKICNSPEFVMERGYSVFRNWWRLCWRTWFLCVVEEIWETKTHISIHVSANLMQDKNVE